MKPVPHGEPYAGKLHVRLQGASRSTLHPSISLGSGHVGVVDYDGEGIAAGTEKVSRWYDFLDGTSGFNQYTGDE